MTPQHAIGLVLVDIRSPINIGMALRLAETFAVRVSLYDPANVLADEEKRPTISDFACGALERVGYRTLASPYDLRGALACRRVIATSITPDSAPLERFSFESGDVIVVGNEYDGLPDDLIGEADATVRIAMADVWTPKPRSANPIDPVRTQPVARDGAPNLNVAISAGILCHAAFVSLRPHAGLVF